MKHNSTMSVLLVLAFLSNSALHAQVPVDHNYDPPVAHPAYASGSGPVVGIDEAHNNSHTAGEGFAPFAKLLRKDGYRVEAFASNFTAQSLQKLDILVIVNALAKQNRTNESLPTLSAFEKSEIDAVEDWVKRGGALLLIAGHMPWPGPAAELAERFDVFFQNGFTFPLVPGDPEKLLMRVDEGRKRGLGKCALVDHPIFAGRSRDERIPSLETAWGAQAFRFRSGGKARPLLVLEGEWMLLFPVQEWQFSVRTPRIRADGMPAAASVSVGKGRAVLFGFNAVWLNAQLKGQEPWGMNQPNAKHNAQFVLNMMHWLTKLLPAE